jgi:hypothetical protein
MKTCRLTFWLLRKTYPWMHVVILVVMATASRDTQQRQQIRLWRTLDKIDFSGLLAIAIELSQPEFWI